MLAKVKAAVIKYGMLNSVNTVYVGLSGGADSVSLLLALCEMKDEFGVNVKAVHINHMLRGSESDRDERFCAELCKRLGIALDIRHIDAAGNARANRLSVEEAARNLRYDIFEAVPDGCKTATAHTLSDSAETVLFNLSRGTGIKGLAGIPPVRDRIIRPLIDCTREDVEAFLSERGQTFVTDSTNLTDNYTRNKIRHNIIPLMEALHGGFMKNIDSMTDNLRTDCDFLEEQALLCRERDLRELHPAMRRRVILNFLKDNSIEADYKTVSAVEEAALSARGGKLNPKKNTFVIAENGRLRLFTSAEEKKTFTQKAAKIGENPFLCDKTVIISEKNCEITGENNIVNNLFANDCLDCDKIQGVVVLRQRRSGDGYVRCGRSFTSSLKKLMNEKYPPEMRDCIPVLADEAGIIWVEGFGIADRVKIDGGTKKILNIRICGNE